MCSLVHIYIMHSLTFSLLSIETVLDSYLNFSLMSWFIFLLFIIYLSNLETTYLSHGGILGKSQFYVIFDFDFHLVFEVCFMILIDVIDYDVLNIVISKLQYKILHIDVSYSNYK